MKTRKILVLLLTLALVFSAIALTVSALSGKAAEGKRINVWLIAGQSNAAGYGQTSNYPDGYSDADALDSGISNVLY